MSASEHISPYQYKLFMTAGELMNVKAGDSPGMQSLTEASDLRKRKLSESKRGTAEESFIHSKEGEETLYESIKKEGVRNPVTLTVNKEWGQVGDPSIGRWAPVNWNETLLNGHHRVVSANDINPNTFIPVRYQ
jgi:hypothetical protein